MYTDRDMKLVHHHVAISVRDRERSLAFYEALGFEQVHFYDDGVKTNTHLKLGDVYIEMFCFSINSDVDALDMDKANDIDKIGVKHIAFAVDDVDAARDEVTRMGISDSVSEISEKQGDGGMARFFFVKDPDGVWVEFIKDERY